MDVTDVLFDRLDDIRNSTKPKSRWKKWMDEPLPLTPWQAWTLFALVRHQERQYFVKEIVEGMNVDLQIFASGNALSRLRVKRQVKFSGLFKARLCFHENGCCFTDRKTGEIIDVNFHGGTATWIDEQNFNKCVESFKVPPFVEARFLALHSSSESRSLSINRLIEQGLVERLGDRPVVGLAFEYDWLYDALQDVEDKWHDKSVRQAVAAAMGDWFLLEELVPPKSTRAAAIRNRVAACRA